MTFLDRARSMRAFRAAAAAGAAVFVMLNADTAVAQPAPGGSEAGPPLPLQHLMRDAAERLARSDPDGGAARAARRSQAPAPPQVVRLTLDEAVKMALEKNLDIAVERVNPQIADVSIASVQATYVPTITTLFGGQRQTSAPITLFTGGQLVTTSTATFNGQLTENLPWAGARLTLAWNNNRVFTNSFFYNFNPAYNATLSAQYTQPLLRGLKTDGARQQLAVAKVNRAISDLQLQATIANTITAVRHAYWDLVLATEAIEVARASVDLAHQLVVENEKRVQAGTMTRLDLVTATSQEANERHTLVVAEGNRRTAELALKRLLAAGSDDPLWGAAIDPVDRPDDRPQPIDVDAAVKRALAMRTDLARARHQAAANEAALQYLRDQTRPQADLVAGYSVAGLGGTQLLRAGDSFAALTGPVVGTVPGAYGDALRTLLENKYPTWGVALNVTYPIGYHTARAEAARAELQAAQVAAETRQLEVQVVTEVTNAAIAARNAFDEIDAARQASDLAAQKLEAEQKKFSVGLSTNYLVVQAQKDLAEARNAVLRAEIAYQQALIDFDRAQQTTLQSAGVTVVSAAIPERTVGSGRPASPAPSGSFVP